MRGATRMTLRARKPSSAGAQRGIALIIVLWIMTLLTLIASSFIHAMRTEINIVGNSVSRAKLDAAATAGVQRAVLEMMKPLQIPDRWNIYGVPQMWEFQGVSMQISMLDESAKIDINVGNEALIRGLLRSQGLGEDEAAALMDAIADWRDPDSLKRLRGAEEADYAEKGFTFKPANAPFQSIEELQLVMGMSPALYERLAPWITIYSRQGGINSQIAAREVLRAIPNVTEAQIELYVQQREQARAARLPVPVFAPAAIYASGGNGVTTMRVEALGEDGGVFVREAVVLRLPAPKRPFTYLRWREGVPSADPVVSAPAAVQHSIVANQISK
jgi:general secretion pathway protein K